MKMLDERERKVFEEVASRYRARGYRVVESPRRSQLPSFLRGYRPDMIAVSDDEKIVVEIKRKDADAETIEHMSNIARELQDRPGWRLDIVIGEAQDNLSARGAPWDYPTIQRKMNIADLFLNRRLFDEAITTTWAAFEAELRLIVERRNNQMLNGESCRLVSDPFWPVRFE